MEHLQRHQYAFLKDGVVINIAVFDGHDSELLEIIKQAHNADLVLSCRDYGKAFIDGFWDGTRFYPKKPHSNWVWYAGEAGNEHKPERWVEPIPMPTDAVYEWSQEDNEWKFIKSFEDIEQEH